MLWGNLRFLQSKEKFDFFGVFLFLVVCVLFGILGGLSIGYYICFCFFVVIFCCHFKKGENQKQLQVHDSVMLLLFGRSMYIHIHSHCKDKKIHD